MRATVKAILVTVALAGAPVAAALPAAAADVGISINPGIIAFGYNDGYWDQSHRWHAWRNRREANWYRDHYRDHYYGHKHNRDHGGGWRAERWWDRH